MEKKFSVVIPTMYKCTDILIELLSVLNEDTAVKEIVLVENATIPEEYKIPSDIKSKIKFLPQEKNIYVNPSWNLGVANCSEEYIAILNDDIIIPDGLFTHISPVDIGDNIGVMGACDFIIQETKTPSRFKIRYIQGLDTEDRLWGFGIMMIMRKSNYYPIPEDLLIWGGDDYIFHQNRKAGKSNMLLLCPIQTKMSTTSNNAEFDSIKERDVFIYESKYK